MAYLVWHNFGGHTKQSVSHRTLSALLCTWAAYPDDSRSRFGGRPTRATAIAMVVVTSNPYPIWWRGITSAPPAQWSYVFEELTGQDTADEWALAAAIFVARTRRRTGHGPTFAELFAELLPDTGGLPAPFPGSLDFVERRRAVTGFRGHTTIEWRRRGMIGWDRDVPRSLRVGKAFRERSRQRQSTGDDRPRPRAGIDAALAPGITRVFPGEPGDCGGAHRYSLLGCEQSTPGAIGGEYR